MAARRLPKNTASEQPRCFGYCRVSTLAQADEGESLDVQRRKIEGRAMELGLTLTHVFVERGSQRPVPIPDGSRAILQLIASPS